MKKYMIYIIENIFYFTELQNTIYLELSIKQYIYILFLITLTLNMIILINMFKLFYKKNILIKKITYLFIIIVVFLISPPQIYIQLNLIAIFTVINEIITYIFDLIHNYKLLKKKSNNKM